MEKSIKMGKSKKVIKRLLIALVSIMLLLGIVFIILVKFGKGNLILPIKKKEHFNEDMSSYPSMLQAQGNKIVNQNGEQVVLTGLMAPDPQKINSEKKFNQAYYNEIFELGGNVIRVPVHPGQYHNDEYYLWRYLDPIVKWAGERGIYVIIDWHYIGNPETGEGDEMPDLKEQPMDYSCEFWKQVSGYFSDTPNVMFEIYNEPTNIDGPKWESCVDKMIHSIRDTGAKQLIIIGSPKYTYQLDWIRKANIEDTNVAYSAHVFPGKTSWKQVLSKYVTDYPLIITEWGYIDSDCTTKQYYLKGNEADFGKPFIEYLNENHVSWVGCWYDDGWEPPMYKEGMKERTLWGEFLLKQFN